MVPYSSPEQSSKGFKIAPVVDLVHMKLTSYRLKDQVDIQDLDHAGADHAGNRTDTFRPAVGAPQRSAFEALAAPPDYSRTIFSDGLPLSAFRVSTISFERSTMHA